MLLISHQGQAKDYAHDRITHLPRTLHQNLSNDMAPKYVSLFLGKVWPCPGPVCGHREPLKHFEVQGH
jgi:hypothetical protein